MQIVEMLFLCQRIIRITHMKSTHTFTKLNLKDKKKLYKILENDKKMFIKA